MILASSGNASNSDFVDSLHSSRDSQSRRGTSPLKLAKTVGVLALALSGGAQSAQATGLGGNRRLMDATPYDEKPLPYDYGSVCDNGVSTPYVQGTNYEDCLAAEYAQIDTIRQSKEGRLDQLKRCYTISGYLAAALFGSAPVGLMVGGAINNEPLKDLILGSAVTNFCAGFAALVPTTVCGAMNLHIKGRLEDSRAKAEECCKVFPTKQELAVFASASENQALAPAPSAANFNETVEARS